MAAAAGVAGVDRINGIGRLDWQAAAVVVDDKAISLEGRHHGLALGVRPVQPAKVVKGQLAGVEVAEARFRARCEMARCLRRLVIDGHEEGFHLLAELPWQAGAIN